MAECTDVILARLTDKTNILAEIERFESSSLILVVVEVEFTLAT